MTVDPRTLASIEAQGSENDRRGVYWICGCLATDDGHDLCAYHEGFNDACEQGPFAGLTDEQRGAARQALANHVALLEELVDRGGRLASVTRWAAEAAVARELLGMLQ